MVKHVTPKVASRMLGVCSATLRRAHKRGDIQTVLTGQGEGTAKCIITWSVPNKALWHCKYVSVNTYQDGQWSVHQQDMWELRCYEYETGFFGSVQVRKLWTLCGSGHSRGSKHFPKKHATSYYWRRIISYLALWGQPLLQEACNVLFERHNSGSVCWCTLRKTLHSRNTTGCYV